MKKEAIQNIQEYEFRGDEHFLLDANIWLYTYGPSVFRYEDKDHIYNDAITKIIYNRCSIYMIIPILSEYIYRYLDQQLKLNGVDKENLKAFRKTDRYKEIVKLIAADVKEILDLVKCCSSMFETSTACGFLDRFLLCNLDFNDVIIEEFCITNNLILITNDGDFKECDAPILTANPNLYR